jgi:putative alpha-1,2-mannosidase
MQRFVIETQHNNGQNIYVQSITLGGRKVKKPFIDLEDVKKGGKLVLQMGDRPKDDYRQ